MKYAFFVDSSACSGCKACQVACKDKHGLEAGRLWRRVYEVAGGGWVRAGEAWQHSVFAYNLSIACNHCEKPACLEACPAWAIWKREDGIVLIEANRCLGCEYCSWACPYGALQYDERSGTMSKCTFCADQLDAGLPPACVSACPLRALHFGDRAELEAQHGALRQVYPLPEPALTQPSLVIKPHSEAGRASGGSLGTGAAALGNWEEV